MISREIYKFIHTIHKFQVIIFKKNKDYYVIDDDVYVLRSLLDFSYCYKNNRKVIFIDSDYVNYVLKYLREYSVSYVVININYGYDRVLDYKSNNNRYVFFYKKGKRIIKNERKVKYIVDMLNRYKDIELLKGVDLIINDCRY